MLLAARPGLAEPRARTRSARAVEVQEAATADLRSGQRRRPIVASVPPGEDIMPTRTTIELPPTGERAWPAEEGSILFVGTATVLVRLGPFTLLTDPNFLHAGQHAHLGYGMTSERLTDPALEVSQLPRLDACVLSHFHGDHWDEVATAQLPKGLPVLTTHHAARSLRRRGFRRARGLRTWDEVTLHRGGDWLRITAVPARHGPGLLQAALPPVIGTVWEVGDHEGPARFRLYVSGDTLVHRRLREIPLRFPRLDVGIFHLGGTRILGFLVTLDAAQGVEAVRIVAPELAIPVHFDDYPVFESPLADFSRAVKEAGLEGKVLFLARGERQVLRFGEPVGRARRVHADGGVMRPDLGGTWPPGPET